MMVFRGFTASAAPPLLSRVVRGVGAQVTEADWLACADPLAMVEFLKDREALRKWRLLGSALYRSPLPWHHLCRPLTEQEWEETRSLVETIERWADETAEMAPWESFEPDFHHWLDVSEALHGGSAAEQRVEAALIRDVFGNPFRPVSTNPAWLTATVRALAQAAYNERLLPVGTLHPSRLAILADALEEAGCTEHAVLDHLRSPGPHVRGCWAVDAVLAKE
jgi:hypothetical protein